MKTTSMKKKTIAAVVAFCMIATTAAPISATEAKTPDSAADKADKVMATVDTVNDTWESPAAISLGINYESEVTETNTVDYYRFTIPSSGTVNLRVSSYVDDDIVYKIYSQYSGYEVWNGSGRIDSLSGRYYGNHDLLLTQGTYIIEVKPGYDDLGKYNFTVSHTPSGESFSESGDGANNSWETASPISVGTTYKGQLALNDTKDYYKFNAKAGSYIFNITGDNQWTKFYFYNSNGECFISSGISAGHAKLTLAGGDYRLVIAPSYDTVSGCNYSFSLAEYIPVLTATTSYTKTYNSDSYYQETFKLDAKSSGGEDILYTSSDAKVAAVNEYGTVTIKGPGKAVITATVEGFPSIQKKITVTIKPAKVASLKAKRTAKNKMTVSWKRDKTVTGYEITYALNKKFTKGKKTVKIGKNKTVKKTIKKLKTNKAYYVKVRAYKTSGGKKIYGKYSKTVKVKVKK